MASPSFGLPDFLKELKRLLERQVLQFGRTLPRGFISYAWDSDVNENKALQQRLTRLAQDLDAVGIKTFLDIKHMHGGLRQCMQENLSQSDYVLVIGTPTFKERVEMDKLFKVSRDVFENRRKDLACLNSGKAIVLISDSDAAHFLVDGKLLHSEDAIMMKYQQDLEKIQWKRRSIGANGEVQMAFISRRVNDLIDKMKGEVSEIATLKEVKFGESVTNVAFEFGFTLESADRNHRSLIPLLYKGKMDESFPSIVMSALIRNMTDEDLYVKGLFGLTDPLGILPAMMPTLVANLEYRDLVARLRVEPPAPRQTFGQAYMVVSRPADVKAPEPPTIVPNVRQHLGSVTVTFKFEAFLGVAIHYTVDGTTPTSDSLPYMGPIILSHCPAPIVFKAITYDRRYKLASTVAEQIYEIQSDVYRPMLAPVIVPKTGVYPIFEVYLRNASKISYALEYKITGPTQQAAASAWTPYNEPFQLRNDGEYVVAARANDGLRTSDIVEMTYQVAGEAPNITYKSGTYGPLEIPRPVRPPKWRRANLFFTIDGSDPSDPKSTREKFRQSIRLESPGVVNFKACWVIDADTVSPVCECMYTITPGLPKPIFDPNPNTTYNEAVSVIIDPNGDFETRYTDNGANPTPLCAKVTGPIKVTETCTLKAINVKKGNRRVFIFENFLKTTRGQYELQLSEASTAEYIIASS